jgi:hypothetical protein
MLDYRPVGSIIQLQAQDKISFDWVYINREAERLSCYRGYLWSQRSEVQIPAHKIIFKGKYIEHGET